MKISGGWVFPRTVAETYHRPAVVRINTVAAATGAGVKKRLDVHHHRHLRQHDNRRLPEPLC